jgi:hypothetical protein
VLATPPSRTPRTKRACVDHGTDKGQVGHFSALRSRARAGDRLGDTHVLRRRGRQFHTEAVEWAAENEITTGTSATTFSPDGFVTRGQNVTFAKRYDDNIVQPALANIEERLDVLQLALEASETLDTYTNTSPPVFAVTKGAGPYDVFTVSCDDGDRATGGGFSGLDANGAQVLSSHRDTENPNTWTVRFFNNSFAADQVAVHVTCLRTVMELN